MKRTKTLTTLITAVALASAASAAFMEQRHAASKVVTRAYQDLYATLTVEQKDKADQLLGHHGRRGH